MVDYKGTLDSRLASRSSYLCSLHQFYDSTTTRLRTQPCATRLVKEYQVGTPICLSLIKIKIYIDGSCAVYRISLSFRGPLMNRCRLIDEVSVFQWNVTPLIWKSSNCFSCSTSLLLPWTLHLTSPSWCTVDTKMAGTEPLNKEVVPHTAKPQAA